MDIIGNRTIRDLLRERAEATPDAIAFIHESANGNLTQFSYAELLETVRRAAQGLASCGVQHGDRVVILLSNSVEFVAAWLGAAWHGAIAVPANTANSVAELRHIASLAEAHVMVTTEDRAAAFSELEPPLAPIETFITAELSRSFDSVGAWLLTPATSAADQNEISDGDLAELIFTSGTTSLPKAVMLTHANYLHSGERESRVSMLRSEDRVLTALPLFHVNAQSIVMFSALTAGATAIILEQYSAGKFWRQVRNHEATVLSIVAMQLRTIIAQPPEVEDMDHKVRTLVYAINVLDTEKEEFERRFGVSLQNGYGLSEAMTSVTAAPLVGQKRWPSIGLPTPSREVRVVDQHGKSVQAGEIGEIVVRGVPGRTLMLGYFRDPQATAETLREGWLFTGDNGRFDNQGYLYFVDRSKDVIKRAGENVSSGEVELVLSSHAAVTECAVIGVPDPIRDEAVKAFVVVAPGKKVSREEIQKHCAESLAKFKVPTIIEFVKTLPKTSIGKVQKKVLREGWPPQ